MNMGSGSKQVAKNEKATQKPYLTYSHNGIAYARRWTKTQIAIVHRWNRKRGKRTRAHNHTRTL